jgi:V/A-type H+-transporting ATPase subunit I
MILLSSSQKYKEEIRSIENEYHTTMIDNIDEIDLKDYQAKVDETEQLEEKRSKLNEELFIFLEENVNILNAYKEVLENISLILKTEVNFSRTAHFITIEGWIPVSKLDFFMKMCNKTTENTALIFVSKKIDIEKPPPSKFKNLPIVRSFETLTRLWGYPIYKEIDPTMILTITFPIIFGLMFGDIGHGLMLFIGGVFFYYRKKNQPGSWKNISIILALCGVCSIIAGFLYGDFFGMNYENSGFPLHPLLFNPVTSMMTALKFSVYIGTAMLSLGFLIEAINYYLEKRKADSFLVAVPKIFFVVGGVYMVLNYGINFNNWFHGPLFILIIPALVLVFGKMMVHLFSFTRILPSEKTASLMGSGLLVGWETFLSFISNIPSFCRIFALSLVHIGLTSAVIMLSQFTNNIILGSIILVGGHIAVVLFEMMLVFVHSLRLHFNEFFGKFYRGTGSQFSPFYLNSQFSALRFKVPSGMD